MRKIGIATLTLLAIATAACAESPVGIHADGTQAALNGGFGGSGNYEEETAETAPEEVVGAADEDVLTTFETARNPGFGGSGN
jgi:hypothetical protein